jgi:hypothetical protein
MKTETLTDDMIIALRREAGEASDRRMVAVCRAAVEHFNSPNTVCGVNVRARQLVSDAINDARAQDNSASFVRVVP